MKNKSSFGAWLYRQRRSLDLTRKALANQVGCAEITLRRIEDDSLKPSQELANILLEKLGICENERPQWVQFARGLTAHPEPPVGYLSAKPLSNLPALLTTFIGRDKDQVEIIQHLKKYRLVTLTGSGGVGKTRLSIKIGEQVLADYTHGVWLLELAPLNDPALLPQFIASIFGLVTSPNIPLVEALANFLRTKTILLILDNCEHLLETCAQVANVLLKKCPNLKILATSREALGILGELSYRVPSLGLPDTQGSLEDGRASESMRLFEERAQLARTDFSLSQENVKSVAQICSRLDGIPLAIELAAAQTVFFSTSQIAARLNESFNLITGGNRTALPRHQTIRASIEWSWNLISNVEHTLLRRLAVFSGGWTLESAEAICSSHGMKAHQILGLLAQLMAKSLVNAHQETGRFRLHEAIRQFAHEKLVEANEVENVRGLHLQYFLALSAQDEPALHGVQQEEWFRCINEERGNIHTAMEHASKTDVEAGLLLTGRLLRYWTNFDLREGLRWTTEFVQKPESTQYPRRRAKALLAQGNILWYLQQFESAHSIADECLALFRACGDYQGEFESLLLMGSVMQFLEGMEKKIEFQRQALVLAQSTGGLWEQALALSALGWDQRDVAQARACREKAIGLFRQIDDWRNLVDTLGILGYTVLLNGDVEAAQAYLDEAYEINGQMNGKRGMEFILTGKSYIALMRGEYDQAFAYLEENAIALEEMGNRMGYLWARARLGYVALCAGNVAEARHILIETVESFHQDQNKSGLAFALDKIASLYVVTAKLEPAARLLGWSDKVRQEIGDPRALLEQVSVDRDAATIIERIGSGGFELAYDSGQGMTLDEALALSLSEK